MNPSIAHEIYNLIKTNPGKKPKELSKMMGKDSRYVYNMLPSLEHYQLFVYEDDSSRLYPAEES